MALETHHDKIIFGLIVPIFASVIGALAATVALLALPSISSGHPTQRKMLRRETANNALLGAFLGALAGLAWAASGVGLALI